MDKLSPLPVAQSLHPPRAFAHVLLFCALFSFAEIFSNPLSLSLSLSLIASCVRLLAASLCPLSISISAFVNSIELDCARARPLARPPARLPAACPRRHRLLLRRQPRLERGGPRGPAGRRWRLPCRPARRSSRHRALRSKARPSAFFHPRLRVRPSVLLSSSCGLLSVRSFGLARQSANRLISLSVVYWLLMC